MKIILQENVVKLGKAGDIVDASNGYFRNYLQPRKLAVVATTGTLKKREEDLASLKKKADKAHDEAVQLCEKIAALGSIRLTAKVGEGGKLFGKITNKEIALELNKLLGIEVDKRLVKPLEDISALGTYKAQVKLMSDVQAELLVEVQPDGFVPAEPKPLAAATAGAADQALAEEGAEPEADEAE